MRTETPWGPWDQPPPDEAARLFAPLRVPWWIAGGHAVEFAVGHAFRDHGDIDALLLRPERRGTRGRSACSPIRRADGTAGRQPTYAPARAAAAAASAARSAAASSSGSPLASSR